MAIFVISASAVVIAASSFTTSYCVLYFYLFTIGVAVIELVLDIVDCFSDSLKLVGLGGCGIFFLVPISICMFCKDVLVFDISKV